MSTIAYFRIEFYSEDGSKDADAAKRAFDWCKENYDWFNGESGDGSDSPFVLKENRFETNDEVEYEGGIDLSEIDMPASIDWLLKPFKAVKAARLVAGLVKEGGYKNYIEGVWERGKTYTYYEVNDIGGGVHPKCIRNGNYLIDDCNRWTYRQFHALFKNEKTGEELLAGSVESTDEWEDVGRFVKGTLTLGETKLPVFFGDDGIYCQFDAEDAVKAFVSELKKQEGYADADESEWKFGEFETQPSFFELYGSNPPVSMYKMIEYPYIPLGLNWGVTSIPPTPKEGEEVAGDSLVISDVEKGFDTVDGWVAEGDEDNEEGYFLPTYKDVSWAEGNKASDITFKNVEVLVEAPIYNARIVHLPKSLKYIGYLACYGPSLEKIFYEGTVEEWNKVELHDNAFCEGGDSTPYEYIPADYIECSDGKVYIDKSNEGEYEYGYYDDEEEDY